MSASALTEKAIATSFKNLMAEKQFEKITVTDITDGCALNRQTFYYHFEDKYELLNFIYYNEVIEPFVKDINLNNFSERLLGMFVVMKNDEVFYRNAFSHSNEEFKSSLLKMAVSVFRKASESLRDKAGNPVSDDDINFISQFFAYGMIGVIISWVTSGMKETPKELATKIKNLVNDCHKISIDRYLGNL